MVTSIVDDPPVVSLVAGTSNVDPAIVVALGKNMSAVAVHVVVTFDEVVVPGYNLH